MIGSAIAVLSTENLIQNIKTLQSLTPSSKVLAMVKANAYGHGLRSVSQRLEQHVYSLGVARIDEAIALREAGVKIPITLMEGVFLPDELLVAACRNFHVVFHDHTQLQWLERTKLPKALQAWLKIDTGMNRLGFPLNEAGNAYNLLMSHASIAKPVGIMSHLACAEDSSHPLTVQQIQRFQKFTAGMAGPKSLASSAAILNIPAIHYDIVRPGLSVYGLSPIPGMVGPELGLKPVMTLQTRIIAIRTIPKGEPIGYGARFVCPVDMRVGVIAIGYGDGYSRNMQDRAPVLVNDKRCTVVGRVSMDMTTIDLNTCPDAEIGDSVTLWGDGLPIEELVPFTNESPNDMICGVQNRVKYHWIMQ